MSGGRVVGLMVALAVLGCDRAPEQPRKEESAELEQQRKLTMEDFEPVMAWPRLQEPKPVTREDAKPLELLDSEPTGEAYRKVPLELGPVVYSGKWLGLGWGKGDAFGEDHVVINVFASRPRDRFHRDIEENLLLEVESGEIGPSFGGYLKLDWARGRALVKKPGDVGVYLLDAQVGELVSVYPEGTHPYVLGRNYWVELGEQVWITAEDEEGQVHLFEWEELGKQPPVPDSPFPFLPEKWRHTSEHSEVWRRDGEGCWLAVLAPPRAYTCLDGSEGDWELHESEPLVDGWRFASDRSTSVAMNVRTGEVVDFGPLCDEDGTAFLRYIEARHDRVRVVCSGAKDHEVWGVWEPRRGLAMVEPSVAREIGDARRTPLYHRGADLWERAGNYGQDDEITYFNEQRGVRVIVGRGYDCDVESLWVRRGVSAQFVWSCGGAWSVVVNNDEETLSEKFRAKDALVARSGLALLLRGQGEDSIRLVH